MTRILALLLTLAVGSGTAVARDQAQSLRIGLPPYVSPMLLVRSYQPLLEQSPFTTLDDLRGHRVATPDRLAVITLPGEATLHTEGDDGSVRAAREYLLAFNARSDGSDCLGAAGKPFSDLVSVTDTEGQASAPLVARVLTGKSQ